MTSTAGPAAGRRTGEVCRRVWRQGHEIELMQRSLAFAALFFVTLVPLLMVIAAASPARGDGIAQWITDGLGLTARGSRSVGVLFGSRGQVLSTTTGLGLAALAVFGVSLTGSMQSAYERIWGLPAGPWHGVWRQAVALAAVTAYLVLAAWSGVPGHGTDAQPALRITTTVLGGVLLFWWLPRLLLGPRAPWRSLLPGAIATMAALAGLRLFSRLVFAPLLVSNAVSYGTVGTVLVVQAWLIGVGFTVYGGSVVGRALQPPRGADHPDGAPTSSAPEAGMPDSPVEGAGPTALRHRRPV
ncbi:ribonuclease BN [Kitasatospora purpeofusca]|uniref:ribonuclease BN n=1 Tax=Kitasatospora purpeofusca TaxID=67352 RepID=UPI0036A35E85